MPVDVTQWYVDGLGEEQGQSTVSLLDDGLKYMPLVMFRLTWECHLVGLFAKLEEEVYVVGQSAWEILQD